MVAPNQAPGLFGGAPGDALRLAPGSHLHVGPKDQPWPTLGTRREKKAGEPLAWRTQPIPPAEAPALGQWVRYAATLTLTDRDKCAWPGIGRHHMDRGSARFLVDDIAVVPAPAAPAVTPVP